MIQAKPSIGLFEDPSTQYPRLKKNIADKSGVQRFLGMCRYLSKFCHNLSETVLPLRDLRLDKREFYISNNHENAFNSAKNLTTPATALRYYILPFLCKWMRLKMQSMACCYRTISLSDSHRTGWTTPRRITLKLKRNVLPLSLAWISGTSNFMETHSTYGSSTARDNFREAI